MNTSDQNGKNTTKVPQGYVVIRGSNGKTIKKSIPTPEKTFLQKLLGK